METYNVVTPFPCSSTLRYMFPRSSIDAVLKTIARDDLRYCLDISRIVESQFFATIFYGVSNEVVQIVLRKVFDGLQHWRVEGPLGGLRRLSIPTRTGVDACHGSEEFFECVVANCPQVEYLDGYKMSLFTVDRLTCEDVWLLKLGDWERFNATCTNLHEFHWVVAPFGDPYFRVLGEHIKPRLKRLSFGVGMNWNWRWYFHDTSEAAGDIPDGNLEQQDYCERPGYGVLATDVSAALKGCPMLDELQIQLYHPMYSNLNLIYDSDDEIGDGIPEHEMINANIFNDQFCETLATRCPFLSRFAIVEVAYVNELSPPHLRNVLGLGLQISVTFGIMMPAVAFFFANTSSGWRFLAGFPLVLAALFLVLAPSLCVESPAWLLMKNRRTQAERVITRLYGVENVDTVLAWLEPPKDDEEGLINAKQVEESLFDPKYRRQLAGAILLSCSQQLSGINAVFYYSSSIFADAGISDPRVGTLIIDFINIWPAFFTGFLAVRFGNRTMILWGLAGMLVMAVGMTVAFLVNVAALSVLFTALYVVIFGVTLGPLVWVMTADRFPDSIRASASSLCIVATPDAMPEMSLPAANGQMFETLIWTTAPTAMKPQLTKRSFLRPHISLNFPQNKLPIIAPKIHAFTAKVHSSFECPGNIRHVFSATGRASHSVVSLNSVRLSCDVDQPL